MKSFRWTNEGLSFLEAVVLKDVATVPKGIRILASRSLEPREWNDVGHTAEQAGNDVRVTFARPVNALHFRIDLIGDLPDSLIVAPQALRVLDAREITALLKTRRAIFLGCARNCENQIEDAIAALSRFGELFKDCSIAVFENDSTDSTFARLSELARRGPVTILRDSGLDRHFPKRTARIAHVRNQLLQWAKAQEPVDYICFADLDGIVNTSMDVGGFLSNFAFEPAWDAVFPVNDDFYYDVWTIRQKDLGNDDFMEVMRRTDASIGKRLARWLAAHAKQLDLRAMDGWLPVESAFGGMSIYKYRAIVDQRFIGLDADDVEVCEHVSVNLSIARSGGRLYINPGFVVSPDFEADAAGTDLPAGIWSSRYLPDR